MSAPISPDQIAYKKKVGRLGQSPVYEVGLIGGLHLILKAGKDGKTTPLGAGPHRAVARHIAKVRNPELELTELSKSDWVDPAHFRDIVPRYEYLTDELARLSAEK
jgi:hypothetical protein